jgi:hypothetical protein
VVIREVVTYGKQSVPSRIFGDYLGCVYLGINHQDIVDSKCKNKDYRPGDCVRNYDTRNQSMKIHKLLYTAEYLIFFPSHLQQAPNISEIMTLLPQNKPPGFTESLRKNHPFTTHTSYEMQLLYLPYSSTLRSWSSHKNRVGSSDPQRRASISGAGGKFTRA